MNMQLKTFTALLLGCAAGLALAQTVVQGKRAPSAVAQAAEDVPAVRVGKQVLRAVPQPALPADVLVRKSAGQPARTWVMRESDHLVGVSSNDLMVVGPELDRMAASVRALGLPQMQVDVYPKINLLLVKTRRFEQLQQVHDRLAAEFAQARFEVPVSYFPRKAK